MYGQVAIYMESRGQGTHGCVCTGLSLCAQTLEEEIVPGFPSKTWPLCYTFVIETVSWSPAGCHLDLPES